MTNTIDEQPMTPAEKVFDDFARVIMKQYSFVGFKKTYPTLLKAICAALESQQPLPTNSAKGVEERAEAYCNSARSNVSNPYAYHILAVKAAFIAGATSATPLRGDSFPTNEEVAVELIARYSGNSRGKSIAMTAFIDCYDWLKSKQPIPSTLISELEDANPYEYHPLEHSEGFAAWNQCIAKLKELLNNHVKEQK
jgi:hypothetical protein